MSELQPKTLVRAEDRIGQRHGKLTVVRLVCVNEEQRAVYEFSCDCGSTVTKTGHAVFSGGTISCGCYRENNAPNGRSDVSLQVRVPRSLPADVQQTMRQEFKIWRDGWEEGKKTRKWKEQRSLLTEALYRIGKLAAIPLTLIPGTEQFNRRWFDMSCQDNRSLYCSALKLAKDACTTVLAQCETNERMRLMGELRLIPQSHRALLGV